MMEQLPLYALGVFCAREVYSIFLGRAKEDREELKAFRDDLVKTQVAIEAIRSDLRFFSRLREDVDTLWKRERLSRGESRPSDFLKEE